MRVICAPEHHSSLTSAGHDVHVILYAAKGRSDASAGTGVVDAVRRAGLSPDRRAWDLMSIALAITAADFVVCRATSPDGWTRQIELVVAVQEPEFWATHKARIEGMLRFLTTDIWDVSFVGNGHTFEAGKAKAGTTSNAAILLSGGLDSLVGAIDLSHQEGVRLFAVSQTTRGDAEKQRHFASVVGGGLPHLQLNHNVTGPRALERSQRARSVLFLAYGVMVGSSFPAYSAQDTVRLYVCENGFISLNPPLTGGRIGSLSTRTTHPRFMTAFQSLLDATNLRVTLENPYQLKTKGEMLVSCADQILLRAYAHKSTSCGRFARHGYEHCGRCVPCLIRRAAFRTWGLPDRTGYRFKRLGQDDANHARSDDVRAAAIAVARVASEGIESLAGGTLDPAVLGDTAPYRALLSRGLAELATLLSAWRVR